MPWSEAWGGRCLVHRPKPLVPVEPVYMYLVNLEKTLFNKKKRKTTRNKQTKNDYYRKSLFGHCSNHSENLVTLLAVSLFQIFMDRISQASIVVASGSCLCFFAVDVVLLALSGGGL